jgi:ABC-type sulfate transport system substrate-binding protein
MPRWFTRRFVPLTLAVALPTLAACTSNSSSDSASGSGTCTPAAVPTLTFAAYSTPREVYDAKIIPAFKAMWKDKTGVEPRPERRQRLGRRRRRPVARSRRPDDPGRRPDHP